MRATGLRHAPNAGYILLHVAPARKAKKTAGVVNVKDVRREAHSAPILNTEYAKYTEFIENAESQCFIADPATQTRCRGLPWQARSFAQIT